MPYRGCYQSGSWKSRTSQTLYNHSEPNALNTPSLVTVGPNSGDGIVIMMVGA